jgi:hypothetical protein
MPGATGIHSAGQSICKVVGPAEWMLKQVQHDASSSFAGLTGESMPDREMDSADQVGE